MIHILIIAEFENASFLWICNSWVVPKAGRGCFVYIVIRVIPRYRLLFERNMSNAVKVLEK
jgi:hypothetical protein